MREVEVRVIITGGGGVRTLRGRRSGMRKRERGREGAVGGDVPIIGIAAIREK